MSTNIFLKKKKNLTHDRLSAQDGIESLPKQVIIC